MVKALDYLSWSSQLKLKPMGLVITFQSVYKPYYSDLGLTTNGLRVLSESFVA